MHYPLAYALGLSTTARAAHLRERMLKTAEKDRRRGLPTRLYFLKKHFCGQDVPDCRPKVDGTPHYAEGEEILIRHKDGWENAEEALRRLSHFNNTHAAIGLQALPRKTDRGEAYRFLIARCSTALLGDLLLSMPALQPPPETDGHYFVPLHQAFIYASHSPSASVDHVASHKRDVFGHECEHAVHLSLWWLADLPLLPMTRMSMEYLSMLVPLRENGNIEIIYNCYLPPGQHDPEKRHYRKASFHFIANLKKRYEMTDDEIMRGLTDPEDKEAVQFAEPMGEKYDPKDAIHHQRLRDCAGLEYCRVYERIFGLPPDAIREIIAGLPLF